MDLIWNKIFYSNLLGRQPPVVEMAGRHACLVPSADLFRTIRNSLTLSYLMISRASSYYLKSFVLDIQCIMNCVAQVVDFPDHSIHAKEVGKNRRRIVLVADSDNLAKVVPKKKD